MELASKTTPHGYEYLMEPFLPGCIKDSFGNYYRIVGDGNHNTMFTSHLDTYFDEENSLSSNAPQDVQLIDLGEQVQTDCTSILGADDRAGIALMITMIKAGVPGLYAFFIGEEVGRLGSIHAAHHNEWKRLRKGIKNVISFDRKGCDSIITHQGINQTCSIEYATALQSAFLKQKMIMQLD